MVKQRLGDLLIGAVVGFVIASVIFVFSYDKALNAAQAYSHEVAMNAAAVAFRARVHADSLKRHSDSLERQKVVTVRQVIADTISAALANRALLAARTARDSNVVYRLENQELKKAVVGLWVAFNIANQQVQVLTARGDSLQQANTVLNANIQALNAKVQGLNPRPPKLLRVSWSVVKYAAVGFAGYECGRRKCL